LRIQDSSEAIRELDIQGFKLNQQNRFGLPGGLSTVKEESLSMSRNNNYYNSSNLENFRTDFLAKENALNA
jgi:hypothetical protein